jgi:hypothetical protein
VSEYAIVEYSIKSRLAEWRQKLDGDTRLPKRWSWHIFEDSELREELDRAGVKIVSVQTKLPYLSNSKYYLLKSVKVDHEDSSRK